MSYLKEFEDSGKEIRFTQANVMVPKQDRARMVALGLKLRASYLTQLVDSKDIDALYAVAAMNMPKLPTMPMVIDAQKEWAEHGPLSQVLGVAYTYMLKCLREVARVQAEKKDSERYIIAHAKAVAYGKMTEAAYKEFLILEQEALLEVGPLDA